MANTILCGDCEDVLPSLSPGSADLIFTSPPYFNAKPEYATYASYGEYLSMLRRVIHKCHRVLAEGRFFVMNVSPILVPRAKRSKSSRRYALPFDLHHIFDEEYDFIDDIIWEKPEGAGWATSRGRRFAADRNPLQYKPVPVFEYILVYRKSTDKLIDWNIRNHPDQESVKNSRIGDEYERTNIWRITPATDKEHPAVFPLELAKRVISYYSFQKDTVLDPFAGTGTVGKAAVQLRRKYILIERHQPYVNLMAEREKTWKSN